MRKSPHLSAFTGVRACLALSLLTLGVQSSICAQTGVYTLNGGMASLVGITNSTSTRGANSSAIAADFGGSPVKVYGGTPVASNTTASSQKSSRGFQ